MSVSCMYMHVMDRLHIYIDIRTPSCRVVVMARCWSMQLGLPCRHH